MMIQPVPGQESVQDHQLTEVVACLQRKLGRNPCNSVGRSVYACRLNSGPRIGRADLASFWWNREIDQDLPQVLARAHRIVLHPDNMLEDYLARAPGAAPVEGVLNEESVLQW